ERAGQGDLEWPLGVAPHLGHHVDLDGTEPSDRSDHPRYGDGHPGAIDGLAGPVEVDAAEPCGKAIRVALASDFAIGHDVEPEKLLFVDRQGDGVALCLGEVL